MSAILRDKTGQVYGSLVVIEFDRWHYFSPTERKARWLCECECGNTTSVLTSSLRPKGVKSCNKCCKSGVSETTIEYLQRIYAECLHSPTDECVNWELSKCVHQGYGVATVEKVSHPASRIVASWHFSKDIADPNWDGCHKCGNRLCINPAHLYAGTRSDNITDQSKQGKHNSAKLSEQDVKEMREGYRLKRWTTYQQVADFYAVSVGTAYKIIKRNHYKWIL